MTVNEEADLAVGGEIHRSAEPVHTSVAYPLFRRREKRRCYLSVILALEKPEKAGSFFPVAIVFVVDVGRDSPSQATILIRQEELDFGVLVEGVLFRREELALEFQKWWDPVRSVLVQAVGQLDEGVEVALGGDG